ncbi:MAG: cbb3-type cytochrome c oxidase N-terminal domain-containing protein [Bacteroidota bacterium]
MKTVASYVRVIGFILIAFLLLEFTTEAGAMATLNEYPVIWAVFLLLVLFAISVEIIVTALKSILFRSLDEAAQAKYLAAEAEEKEKRYAGLKKWYQKMLGSKPIAQEEEIILDHNYDGIKELDNSLPPWWVYLFYVTIVFAAVYLIRFEVFKDYTQAEEYEAAVAEAQLEIEEYKRNNPDIINAANVELLTEGSDLAAGKAIFAANCVACHKADGGGGIGPNLTDEYWILGGGIKNIFTTLMEGGRAGKGMISWKDDLSPLEMAQVGSYVLSFQGTTPSEPKAAEGELWVDPDAAPTEADSVMEAAAEVVDSTATTIDEPEE